MIPIIFWTLVILAGAWALYTGLTTPEEATPDTNATSTHESRVDDRRAA